jgi:hypothetical protein
MKNYSDSKYTERMHFGTLLHLSVALYVSLTVLGEPAWAANTPVRSTTLSPSAVGPDVLESYLSPTHQVVQELQSGFNRLGRMCTYGTVTPQPNSSELDLLATQVGQSRDQLRNVQVQIKSALAEFHQNSSLSRASYCRVVPTLSLLGVACQAYRQDASLAASVVRVADQLTAEAALRLDLYEKYAQLEARGCTRPGFAIKLWQTEQNLLWPLVVDSPGFFRRQLVPAK